MVYVKKSEDMTNKRAEGERFTVIRFIALDEAPAVDINNLTFHSPGTPEHIKSADRLSEAFADFSRPSSFLS